MTATTPQSRFGFDAIQRNSDGHRRINVLSGPAMDAATPRADTTHPAAEPACRMLLDRAMSSPRTPDAHKQAPKQAGAPEVDPAGQSPDDPIEFTSNNEVARGNAERANAEPEPAALHAAEVPGKPDVARRRRELAKHDDSK